MLILSTVRQPEEFASRGKESGGQGLASTPEENAQASQPQWFGQDFFHSFFVEDLIADSLSMGSMRSVERDSMLNDLHTRSIRRSGQKHSQARRPRSLETRSIVLGNVSSVSGEGDRSASMSTSLGKAMRKRGQSPTKLRLDKLPEGEGARGSSPTTPRSESMSCASTSASSKTLQVRGGLPSSIGMGRNQSRQTTATDVSENWQNTGTASHMMQVSEFFALAEEARADDQPGASLYSEDVAVGQAIDAKRASSAPQLGAPTDALGKPDQRATGFFSGVWQMAFGT